MHVPVPSPTVPAIESPEEVPGPRWYGDDLVLDTRVLISSDGTVPVRRLPPRRTPARELRRTA